MNRVGIDIGSTTVKIAILDEADQIIFSAYERHFANIQETLQDIIKKAYEELGDLPIAPMITGSGGLTISKHLDIPFVQEVVSVAASLKKYAPRTDVAIELGGEDAKIIYFTDGIEQRRESHRRLIPGIFVPNTCVQHLPAYVSQKAKRDPGNKFLKHPEVPRDRGYAEPADQRHRKLKHRKNPRHANHLTPLHPRFVQPVRERDRKRVHAL